MILLEFCVLVQQRILSLRCVVFAVALLGLVSPGAAIDGCHPIFFLKNLTTFYLVIASESGDRF